MDAASIVRVIAVGSAVAAIIPAFALESRRRRTAPPGTRPFTWGYLQGVANVVFGTVMLGAGLWAGGDGISEGLVLAAIYAIPGYFVLRRRRWAWVVLTVASLNPLLWIAHFIYGRNRWQELRPTSSPVAGKALGPKRSPSPRKRRRS